MVTRWSLIAAQTTGFFRRRARAPPSNLDDSGRDARDARSQHPVPQHLAKTTTAFVRARRPVLGAHFPFCAEIFTPAPTTTCAHRPRRDDRVCAHKPVPAPLG